MSLFGEFNIPVGSFALSQTLSELPDVAIEIERVVATDEYLTPYFWVSGSEADRFESVSEADPSVRNVSRLDEFERSTLYRADWTENTETIIYAYTDVGATILEASGRYDEWRLRMRFDEHADLQQFQNHCDTEGIQFELTQLHELTQPRSGSQYGLTPRQYDALVTARELGYYGESDVTLADVADELDITSQSLSGLLQRGYGTLIDQTLLVKPQ